MALRGHAVDPGLDRHPDALRPAARLPAHAARARGASSTLETYIDAGGADTRLVVELRQVHRLAAEGVVRRRRDRRRTTTASSTCRRSPATTRTSRRCCARSTAALDGLFLMGQNPAVGSQHAGLQRRALARPRSGSSCATSSRSSRRRFWRDSPEVASRRAAHRGHPDRGLPDARRQRTSRRRARSPTPSGCCSGATRRSTRPATRARELWFMHHLVQARPGALRGLERRTRDWPIAQPAPGTTPSTARSASPTSRTCCARSTATTSPTGEPVDGFAELEGRRLDRLRLLDLLRRLRRRRQPGAAARPRRPRAPTAAGSRPSGRWAWPANRRMLYNRASRRPGRASRGRSARSYVWWDEDAGQVDRLRRPRLPGRQARRTTAPPPDAEGMDAIAGDDPFIMMADGRGWLYAPSGLLDGPMPTHYEPIESPVDNLALPRGPGATRRRCAGTRRGQPATRSPATRATRTSRRPSA